MSSYTMQCEVKYQITTCAIIVGSKMGMLDILESLSYTLIMNWTIMKLVDIIDNALKRDHLHKSITNLDMSLHIYNVEALLITST